MGTRKRSVSGDEFTQLLISGVDLTGITVVDDVRLGNAVIEHPVSLDQVTFLAHVNFCNATFRKAVDFSGSRFEVTLNLGGWWDGDHRMSSFWGDVKFGNAVFLMAVDCGAAIFHGNVDMGSVMIDGNLCLNEAQFHKGIHLRKATIGGLSSQSTRGEVATFNGPFHCGSATIKSLWFERVPTFNFDFFPDDATFGKLHGCMQILPYLVILGARVTFGKYTSLNEWLEAQKS